jgi:sulfur transfer complex TusBCD TusB component (DsrH family)
MARYLLIESRDPHTHGDVAYLYDLAHGLLREGHEVTLYLVQNGVFAARHSPRAARLYDIARAGVRVVADDFSLRERGIGAETLAANIRPASIDLVVDLLADKATRAMWH